MTGMNTRFPTHIGILPGFGIILAFHTRAMIPINMANSSDITIRNMGVTPEGGLSGGGATAFGPITFVGAVDISDERCQ